MADHAAIDHTGLTGVGGTETLPVSIIAAKGDLIVGTANDTAAVLTAGTNDFVLTAASGEATGLKWAAAGAGGGAVATDPIWDAAGDLAVGSGADTAAKLTKGSDGGVLAMGNGAVIWNAGTSFPASKATGDRFWRTDLGMECYWNGTAWVTTQIFESVLGFAEAFFPFTVNANAARYPVQAAYGMWLMSMYGTTYVSTANSGNTASHYWTMTLNRVDSGNTPTSLGNFTTAADTVATWTQHSLAINAALNAAGLHLKLAADKTGTPGALHVPVALRYRLIAT